MSGAGSPAAGPRSRAGVGSAINVKTSTRFAVNAAVVATVVMCGCGAAQRETTAKPESLSSNPKPAVPAEHRRAAAPAVARAHARPTRRGRGAAWPRSSNRAWRPATTLKRKTRSPVTPTGFREARRKAQAPTQTFQDLAQAAPSGTATPPPPAPSSTATPPSQPATGAGPQAFVSPPASGTAPQTFVSP
jgi:hypothetical protein